MVISPRIRQKNVLLAPRNTYGRKDKKRKYDYFLHIQPDKYKKVEV